METCFHVATLIPNRARFAKFQNKKRHIGNDFVIVLFADPPSPAVAPVPSDASFPAASAPTPSLSAQNPLPFRPDVISVSLID